MQLHGPYDIAFVEGSITTPHDARAHPARCGSESRFLVTIGACATAGGIQALRNWADVEEYKRAVYPQPGVRRRRSPPPPRSPSTYAWTSRSGAARSTPSSSSPWSASLLSGARPFLPASQRVPGVQASRQRVCRRGARRTLPRPGDADRLRRALSSSGPRVLRLLRPGRRSQHAGVRRPAARPGVGSDGRGAQRLRGINGYAHPWRESGDAIDKEQSVGSSASTRSPGSRVAARCTSPSRATGSSTCASRSSSRRASSTPCCAAATPARPPTSRRASAASVRWPTR